MTFKQNLKTIALPKKTTTTTTATLILKLKRIIQENTPDNITKSLK